MKIIIDPNFCVGCGLCPQICPEVFEMEDDKAVVKAEVIPGEFEDACKDAIEKCPVFAIMSEE